MARKRPIEDPPPAFSEEKEDEDDEVEEEQSSPEDDNSAAEDDDEPQNDAQDDEDEEEEDDDDEDEEDEDEEKTPLKKHKTFSGKDRSESESDVESDKSLPSPNVSDFTIKPIVANPQKSASNPKLKPKPIAAESSSKPKKTPSAASNGGAGNMKTPGGSRLWSEADEIAILKGMIEYKSKKGSDPNSDSTGFHDFIKDFIQADVSKYQLTEKIRRLKKKYQINAEKGQDGNDPVFSKPHDHKCFELSKKIWGSETNGKISKSRKKMKTSGSEDQEKKETNGGMILGLPSLKNVKEENGGISTQASCVSEKEKEALWKDYPCLMECVDMGVVGNLGAFSMSSAEDFVGVIGKEKLKEMEREFKRLKIEELKLFLLKLDLGREMARAVLDVIKGF